MDLKDPLWVLFNLRRFDGSVVEGFGLFRDECPSEECRLREELDELRDLVDLWRDVSEELDELRDLVDSWRDVSAELDELRDLVDSLWEVLVPLMAAISIRRLPFVFGLSSPEPSSRACRSLVEEEEAGRSLMEEEEA